MRRWLFNIAAGVSLVLCVAAAALWGRSLTHFEQIGIGRTRWPQANEYRTFSVGLAWHSNTLRLDVRRYARLPAYFDNMLPERSSAWRQQWTAEFRANHPPGWRWNFDGERETLLMNGYPPGWRARYYPSKSSPNEPGGTFTLSVRPWLPTLLTAVLPAIWLYRFLKARRAHRPGLCQHCGYDLRATPDRCPECGTVAGPP
jgi:hypothetical protein